MTYTIVICYPCPVTRQQRAQSSSIGLWLRRFRISFICILQVSSRAKISTQAGGKLWRPFALALTF